MQPSPPPSSQAPAPIIRERAGDLLAGYDVLFCDVWGVIHNGVVAYAEACDALTTFRASGGTVILVSNAPVPKHRVADMLQIRRVPRNAWDDIVSSGDLALTHVKARGYSSLYCIGPRDRDAALFTALKARATPLNAAEAILCSGLNDDRNEVPEDYKPLLKDALAADLHFVCANPDFVVDVGGTLYYCAGAIADLYEHMGGTVFWAGKPYLSAYETAHSRAETLRGANVEKSKILVIGDAIRTDLKGARMYGCDALFIAGGIHRHETMDGDALSAEKLAALFAADGSPAIGAMAQLAW